MTGQELAEGLFYFVVVFILTLSFVIFIHELGHYLMARRFGVRITKFSIGFGKEICGFYDRAGTRWCLSWIPLGGYVEIFGDVDPAKPEIWDAENKCPRPLSKEELREAFCTKTLMQRSLIVAAGPMINVALTFLILTVTYSTIGQRYNPTNINMLGIDTAAQQAGLELGDVVLEVDGKRVDSLSDVHNKTWYAPEHDYLLKVLRSGEEIEITLRPESITYTDTKGVERAHGRTGMLNAMRVVFKSIKSVGGIDTSDNPDLARDLIKERMDQKIIIAQEFREGQMDYYVTMIPSAYNGHLFDDIAQRYDDGFFLEDPLVQHHRRLYPWEAFAVSGRSIWEGIKETGNLISVIHKGKSSDPVVSGVGDVSHRIGNAAQDGFYEYLHMLAILSFMIGFINILPVPVFDGGYLLFFLIEAIRGKPVSRKVQDYAMILGLVFIAGIMIIANTGDLIRFLSSLD